MIEQHNEEFNLDEVQLEKDAFIFPINEKDLQQHTKLSKKELIEDAIKHNLTKSKVFAIAETEFLCKGCEIEPICKYAWDLYNISDNTCLAMK